MTVKQYSFVPSNDKGLRVLITNKGGTASGACKLELTVRKINGTAVGRKITINVPSINPGETKSIAVDTKEILPKNVSLKDTTFKLIIDSAEIVNESNETNNETWHNLN